MKTFTRAVLFVSATFALVGCGNPGQAFVGSYTATGTSIATFNTSSGQQTSTLQESGSRTIIEGVASDIILQDGNCNIPFNADDSESAAVLPGATCTDVVDGITVTVTYNSGAAYLTKRAISLNLAGSMTVVANGQTLTGTFTTTQTLNKLGK